MSAQHAIPRLVITNTLLFPLLISITYHEASVELPWWQAVCDEFDAFIVLHLGHVPLSLSLSQTFNTKDSKKKKKMHFLVLP